MPTFSRRFKLPSPALWPLSPPPTTPRPIASDTRTPFAPPSTSPFLLSRADGRPAPLDGLYKGRHLFLVLSGPSLKSLDLTRLHGRGIVSMGVNNSWLVHRPDLWVGVDPPGRFADIGWKDPGIVKFAPRSSLNTRLRFMREGATGVEGDLRLSKFRTRDMPSTYFFHRNSGFDPATFFHEDAISWGTLKGDPDALGITNTRSVMLAAIRLAHHLGFGHVYLLGCDFAMSPDTSRAAYAWHESKHRGARASNNNMYNVLSRRLTALQSHIRSNQIPFHIYNCNPHSGLKCFPHLPFATAVSRATRECSKPVPTSGWYTEDKKKRPRPTAPSPAPVG